MPKMGLTIDEKKAKRRQYTRENRSLWKSLGFRMMSAPVHDDDREEVLAELEVMRCKRMAKIAESERTGISTLVQLGRRNLSAPPSPKEMSEYLQLHAKLDNINDIEYAIEEAKKAHTKFRNCSTNANKAVDEMVKQRLFAKEVAYGNLSSAYYKLAVARVAAGSPTKVFDTED